MIFSNPEKGPTSDAAANQKWSIRVVSLFLIASLLMAVPSTVIGLGKPAEQNPLAAFAQSTPPPSQPPASEGTIFTVNVADNLTQDRNGDQNYCDPDHCSFIEAIFEANKNPGRDTIFFEIGSGGPQTISPDSWTPNITDPVIIDATTQDGYNGKPLVELNGDNTSALQYGLNVTAGNSVIKGLVINRFDLSGILLQGNGGNIVQNNYIGTDATGESVLGNKQHGIVIHNSPGNLIGGTEPQERNVISGNSLNGILVIDEGSSGNYIEGNFIGTSAAGNRDLGNLQNGILVGRGTSGGIGGASYNFIGGSAGTSPGGACTGACNLISGNNGIGVVIAGGVPFQGKDTIGNQVLGNFIGVDVTGANDLGNTQGGVSISASTSTDGDKASLTEIGGDTPQERNIISGNDASGIVLRTLRATENTIKGNFIGTNSKGDASLSNSLIGIHIVGATKNTIGGPAGTTPGGACTGECNLISGNTQSGISIMGATGSENKMVGNFVGTDVNGARAIANGQAGILLTAETTTSGASSKNIVGGTTPAERNLISGNTLDGIQIAAGSNENIIQGNYIGTNSTASAAVPNKNSGIAVINAPRNTIGGVTTSAGSGAGNLITGNTFHGIIIVNFGSTGNNVLGNVIGADVDSCGATTFGNSLYGIRIRDASNNKIGGVQDGQRNVIANNGQSGVQVIATTAAAGNSIRGNTLQDNGGLGIDLNDNNTVEPNDAGDADPGPNSLMNYPTGLTVENNVDTGGIVIKGSLDTSNPSSAIVDLYGSNAADPSGFGEGKIYLGQATPNDTGVFQLEVSSLHFPFVSATATSSSGSTSEFSATVQFTEDSLSQTLLTSGNHFIAADDETKAVATEINTSLSSESQLLGSILLRTFDRLPSVPLQNVRVELIDASTGAPISVGVTDTDGKFSMDCIGSSQEARLKVSLTSPTGLLSVIYEKETQEREEGGLPLWTDASFIETPSFSTTAISNLDIVLVGGTTNSKSSRSFIINDQPFMPFRSNLPLANYANFVDLAAIYYYGNVAIDSIKSDLGISALFRPLLIAGFYPTDDDGASWQALELPHGTSKDPSKLINVDLIKLDTDVSSLSDTYNTEEEIDTLLHEMGHYITSRTGFGEIVSDTSVHPDLESSPFIKLNEAGLPVCHQGYAHVKTECSLVEGLGNFMSAVITQKQLNNFQHQSFWQKAAFLDIEAGYDIESGSRSIVGPRVDDKDFDYFREEYETIFLYDRTVEEFAIAAILWDLYDDTPNEDPVQIDISRLWQVIAKDDINDLYQLYTALRSSGIVPLDALNRIFGSVDACIDADSNFVCNQDDDIFGESAWRVRFLRGGFVDDPLTGKTSWTTNDLVFQYSADEPRRIPTLYEPRALLLKITDSNGVPLSDYKIVYEHNFQDYKYQSTSDIESQSPVLEGFFMNHPSNAILTFVKHGYKQTSITLDSTTYWNGVMDSQQYALRLPLILKLEDNSSANNIPPSIHISEPLVEQIQDGRAVVRYDASATDDIDGEITPVCDLPSGSTFPIGNSTITCTATDSAGNAAIDFAVVTVGSQNGDTNLSPVANAGADQTVEENTLVILSGANSSDTDGSISSYSWEQTGGPSVNLNSTSSATVEFTAPEVSEDTSLSFDLTVVDNEGASATDRVDVLVVDVGTPPPANSPPYCEYGSYSELHDEGSTIVLRAPACEDADGDPLTYQWVQTIGPIVDLLNSASATASFIAPQVTLPTYLQFDLTVTDGKIDTAIPIALADITINNKILTTGAGVTPNFATPIKISNSNAFHSEESALASAGTNVYVSWWDRLNVGSGTSEIFFRKIANNGATPGDIVNISKTSGGELAPAVAATGNNVYLAWIDQADFGGDDDELYFTRSTDGGNTFVQPINLSSNSATLEFRAPRIAAVGNYVYVIWSDSQFGNSEILFRRSIDGGATFEPTVNLSITSGNSNRPVIALGAGESNKGHLYVSWLDHTTNPSAVLFKRSTDFGATFDASINLGPSSRAFGTAGSKIVVEPNSSSTGASSVYVVWSEPITTGSSSERIVLRKSADSGATFGSAMRPTTQFGFASTGPGNLDTEGNNVYLSFAANSGGKNSLFLQKSTNGGTTFGTPSIVTIPGGPTGVPHLFASKSNVYLVGGTNVSPGGQIFFTASTNNATSFDGVRLLNAMDGPEDELGPALPSGPYIYAAYTTDYAQAYFTSILYDTVADPVDTMPPAVTGIPERPFDAISPVDGEGWYNHTLGVKWIGNEEADGSGIASCDPPTTYSSPDAADASIIGHCTDNAGNVGEGSFTFNYDATKPAISHQITSPAAPNSSGWYNVDVQVQFSATDATSGIYGPTIQNITLSSEGADLKSVVVFRDNAGNSQFDEVGGIDIDKTKPTMTSFTGAITEGAQYTIGSVPANNMACVATDSLSGIDEDGCNVTGYDAGLGTHTLTATAKDKAGNTVTQAIRYSVLEQQSQNVWRLLGFYHPVDMNGVVNTIKAGQSVPMKFEVFVNNVEMTDPTIGGTTIKSFTQQRISCDTFVGDPVDAVEQTNTGGTSLRYDTTSGQFVANWKTPGGPKDSCWKAQVTAMDGTSALEAFFRLK